MGALTNLLGNSPRVAVVEAFAENCNDELSGPEIEMITGKARGAVYYTIEQLCIEGLIIKVHGSHRPVLYQLNINDIRAQILPYVEHALAKGQLEAIMKDELGQLQEEPLVRDAFGLQPDQCVNDIEWSRAGDSRIPLLVPFQEPPGQPEQIPAASDAMWNESDTVMKH